MCRIALILTFGETTMLFRFWGIETRNSSIVRRAKERERSWAAVWQLPELESGPAMLRLTSGELEATRINKIILTTYGCIH